MIPVLGFLYSAKAQTDTNPPCPCCTEDHKAFDFWVGDWVVFDTIGNQIGENLILKLESDCILQENWKSAGGFTGSSYNYYNRNTDKWNQLWIDNSGGSLNLSGQAVKDKMVMSSKPTMRPDSTLIVNQIEWQLNKDGSVTQTWNTLDPNGKLLSNLFVGIYKKRPAKE